MIENILDLATKSQKTKQILTPILNDCEDTHKLYGILKVINEIKLDESCLVSEILNFCLKEDEEHFVKENFDEDVLSLFLSLKQLEKYSTQNLAEAENFRMMLFAISKDIRVIIIKLCLLLYELRNLEKIESDKDKIRLIEVREIYAPLAERLGLNFIKSELEDICLKFLEPQVYEYLLTNVMLKKDENDKQIALTKTKLENILKELKIEGHIYFRQKHFSSVNKKMKSKNIPLAKIYDLIAMRVIVNTVEDCYAVLGCIHGVYRPMPDRFKDYIANPKPNGYQSLHTTIIAENLRPLEIQIRTMDMHKVSEYGIAAHWIYKEKRVKKSMLDEKLSFIRSIMENTDELSSKELIEIFKTQLSSGTIFVQTPKGKILDFPEGATVIDFAYSIHSDIGNACVGGKINGKIKPISTKLENGDVVEIITSQNSKGPSRDWLKIVVTASAKNKIRYFFRKEFKEENIKTGKRIVEEELKTKGLEPSSIFQDKAFEIVYGKLCFNNIEELFAAVGYGSISVKQVVNRLLGELQKEKVITSQLVKPKLMVSKNKDGVLIDGDSGILIRYANCCTPVSGDEIIGYISRGKGVTIHRKSCHNVKFLEPERLIDAEWNDKSVQSYKATLTILSEPNEDFIQKMLRQIMENKIFILSFNSKQNKFNQMLTNLNIQVNNIQEIDKAVSLIKNNSEVFKVERND